jgi:hypothetical protein
VSGLTLPFFLIQGIASAGFTHIISREYQIFRTRLPFLAKGKRPPLRLRTSTPDIDGNRQID